MSPIKRPRFGGVFLFCPATIRPIQTFTAAFISSMQLYRQRHKTARRALQALFLRFCPLNRPRYQTDTSGYNTICATLEHITAPERPPAHTKYHRRTGRCVGQYSRHIIIRYIRVQRCAPVMDPCQTVQQTADHASPAAACNLEPSTRLGQSSGRGRGGRRGTIDGSRRISFRAFAR